MWIDENVYLVVSSILSILRFGPDDQTDQTNEIDQTDQFLC
jgi:hypothetical protein